MAPAAAFSGPASGPARPSRSSSRSPDRLEQLRERVDVRVRPLPARDLVHGWRRAVEREPAVGRDLAERRLGGLVEVEVELRPVVRPRREPRDLPG